MTIETKFSLKDIVYFMRDNKVVTAVISAVKTFNVGTNQDCINYNATDYHQPKTWLDYENLHEDQIFHTKEDLFATL